MDFPALSTRRRRRRHFDASVIRPTHALASCSQTPDEMYFGTGQTVPGLLKEASRTARDARLAANRPARR
jgi:hypothetical protein